MLSDKIKGLIKSKKMTLQDFPRELGNNTVVSKKINSNNLLIIELNSLLLLLGMMGIISPQLAAILHNSTTVGISINAMRPILETKRG